AAVLWALSIIFAPEEPDLLRITVESQAMSETIEGASVTVGDVRYMTDPSGSITIDPVAAGTEVRVSAAGHETTLAEISVESGEDMTVSLSAVLVLGTVSD